MIVTLDGQRLPDLVRADTTLQALIDEARAAHLGDRLVVSVAIDGYLLPDKELGERLARPLGDVAQVDLTSADRRQLVVDALREIADRLRDAADEQTEIAEQMQGGKVPDAMGQFGQFMQVWQACQQTIADCSGLLGVDLTAFETGGKTVRGHLDGLVEKFHELRDAFEARDMVLVADMIRYELPDICRAWQNVLNGLAAEILTRAHQASAPAS